MPSGGTARRVFVLAVLVALASAASAFVDIPVVTPHNLWFAVGAFLLLVLSHTLSKL